MINIGSLERVKIVMLFLLGLILSTIQAVEPQAPDKVFSKNSLKYDFFSKVHFVSKLDQDHPKLPSVALEPVIVPTIEYNMIKLADVAQGDLDYLTWFFNYQTQTKLEAFCLYRKMLQPNGFTVGNLISFRLAISHMTSKRRYDLMDLTDTMITTLIALTE